MDAGRKVLKKFWGGCGGVAGGFRPVGWFFLVESRKRGPFREEV